MTIGPAHTPVNDHRIFLFDTGNRIDEGFLAAIDYVIGEGRRRSGEKTGSCNTHVLNDRCQVLHDGLACERTNSAGQMVALCSGGAS